jgi:hypothetical protein
MYYEDYDNYCEPSQADEILEEAKEKLFDILKDEVKSEIKIIREENLRLKQENEAMKEKVRTLDSRERNIEYREKELERTTEYSFYKKKFSELLKPIEENLKIWYVDRYQTYGEKCSLCDEDREIDYISSTGKTIKGDCDCKKYITIYRVVESELNYIDFYKSDRNNREFVVTPKYDSGDYDRSYFKVNIQKLTNVFDINKIEEYKCYSGYNGFSAFTSEEECKKYCDWLNANKVSKENEEKRKGK